jgi:hypothetical protein
LPTTPEHALELHLFTRFAFCSYGFYLAAFSQQGTSRPAQELLVRKTGIAPEDLLYFNHSVGRCTSDRPFGGNAVAVLTRTMAGCRAT